MKKKIDFKFWDVGFGFREGLCDVIINQDSTGYIDKKGERIISLKDATCYPFQNGLAEIWYCNENDTIIPQNTQLINKKGKVIYDDILPIKYRWLPESYYSHIYKKNGKQGLLNKKGDTLTRANYDCMASIIEGRMIYMIGDKWGIMDKKGKIILEPVFEDINHFHEGLAKFKMNNRWGYINKKGKIVIDPVFEKAADFQYGLASVSKNGKLCFINKKGRIVIETDYQFDYNYFNKIK